MAWRDFVGSHREVLAAVDFFTAKVWTSAGLFTHYVLVFMRVASRQVCVAGMTTSPDSRWSAWQDNQAPATERAGISYGLA